MLVGKFSQGQIGTVVRVSCRTWEEFPPILSDPTGRAQFPQLLQLTLQKQKSIPNVKWI